MAEKDSDLYFSFSSTEPIVYRFCIDFIMFQFYINFIIRRFYIVFILCIYINSIFSIIYYKKNIYKQCCIF